MAIQLDEQGNPIKVVMILQAGSALQMEQQILESMKMGYEMFGEMSFTDGMFTQVMRINKKLARSGI